MAPMTSIHSSGRTLSIRWQSAKNMILGHFLTSDVIVKSHYFAGFAIWLIGLMKLFAVGRSNFRFHDQHWFGGCLIKVLKMMMRMLRMQMMVWLTDVPPGVVSRTASRDLWSNKSVFFKFSDQQGVLQEQRWLKQFGTLSTRMIIILQTWEQGQNLINCI